MDVTQGNDCFVGTLRATLDPRVQYPPTTDLVLVAKNLSRDLDRFSDKLERQRKRLKAVGDHEQQISTLTSENTRLND